MQVLIEESTKLRRASASIREGGHILVKIPRHWPRHLKTSVAAELVDRIQQKNAKEKEWLARGQKQPLLTIRSNEELTALVKAINAETFQVPLGKVQIGWAKYNHLAQLNLRTKTMTVSKYCLHQAPSEALRYLIVHELAHYFESGHGPRFWKLVAQYVPDYRVQSRIMKAFHHQAVIAEGQQAQPNTESALLPAGLTPVEPSSRPLEALPPKKKISKPKPLAKNPMKPVPVPNQKNKTGPWPGFIKQLKFWEF